jgi:hypothetical protein
MWEHAQAMLTPRGQLEGPAIRVAVLLLGAVQFLPRTVAVNGAGWLRHGTGKGSHLMSIALLICVKAINGGLFVALGARETGTGRPAGAPGAVRAAAAAGRPPRTAAAWRPRHRRCRPRTADPGPECAPRVRLGPWSPTLRCRWRIPAGSGWSPPMPSSWPRYISGRPLPL